jgi:hypothetical protein
MNKFSIILLLLLLVGSAAFSQSLSDSGRFSSITFDKLLTTYRWNGLLHYTNRFGPLSLKVNERFTSSYIRIDKGLIRDEQVLGLSVRYDLAERWKAVTEVSSYVLSDNKSIGIGNASSHGVYGGLGFLPQQNILIEPLIGFRIDNQIDQYDRGVSYLLRGSATDLDYYGYSTNVLGRFQYDKLDPRTLSSDSAIITVRKNFFGQTRNALQFRYLRNSRDFYFAADSGVRRQFNILQNIETRAERTFGIGDSLDYAIGDRGLLTFNGNIISRLINRETRYRTSADNRLATEIHELRIEGSAQATLYIGKSLDGSFRLYYQERNEQHKIIDDPDLDRLKNINNLAAVEEQKNNQSHRTSLSSGIHFRPSKSDTLIFSGSGTLLRYDTPSLGNLDDRDELWYVLNITTLHKINRYLHVTFSADANLTHLVYLSSRRSADNTWNRILRISPRVVYSPTSGMTTMNRFEVLANYTVYDFEYLSSSTRSFSFRQFAFIDSTTIELTQKLAFEWFNHLKLYERGDLRWDAFSERPVAAFEDKTFSGTLVYSINYRLLFSVGIRYFNQLRFGYSGSTRYIERSFRSIGPTTAIRWNVSNTTEFLLNGWFEHQSMSDQPNSRYANMSMSLNMRI